MTRLITSVAAAAVLAGSLAVLPVPAAAQAGGATLVVYGNDPCPSGYICIRKGDSERYRLPQNQQLQGSRQERQSWAEKSKELTSIGSTGPGSCSPVGPGGHTGCLIQEIKKAKQEAREAQEQSTTPEQ